MAVGRRLACLGNPWGNRLAVAVGTLEASQAAKAWTCRLGGSPAQASQVGNQEMRRAGGRAVAVMARSEHLQNLALVAAVDWDLQDCLRGMDECSCAEPHELSWGVLGR